MTAPKATTTATVNGHTLTFALPVDRPGRASAILSQSSAIVRGGRTPEQVRAAIEGAGTLDEIEAQHDRLTASHGLIIGHTLQGRDLDAAARLRLPEPVCPSCGGVQSIALAGQRRCIGCDHVWTDPDDARRFVGPGLHEAFGRAVVDELVALGVPLRSVREIGAHLQGALAHIAGTDDGGKGSVSFS